MDPLGLSFSALIVQAVFVTLLIGLPIISLIDLVKKNLSGTPLAVWVLVICAVPVLGSMAYWIIRPTPEAQQN
jgi:hypothetical protein